MGNTPFSIWQTLNYTPYMNINYNIGLKRLLWINGWSLDSREPVLPEGGPTIPLGLAGTGLTNLIECKLRCMCWEPGPTLR
jgi:hypothetical protein